MSNQCQNPNDKLKYDLASRTSEFSVQIIRFLKSLPQNNINNPIINQTVRAATSVGANYMEADCAESKKDFIHKISICKKESKETMYWIHMIATANPERSNECKILYQESREFVLIFSKIIDSSKNKKTKI